MHATYNYLGIHSVPLSVWQHGLGHCVKADLLPGVYHTECGLQALVLVMTLQQAALTAV